MEDQETYSTTETAKILGVGARRIQQLADAGEISGERHGRAWRLAKWSVHQYLEDHGPGRPRVPRPDRDRGGSEEERILRDQVGELREELGRLRGRAELEEITRSTLDEQLRRERERADRLEEETRQLRDQLTASQDEQNPADSGPEDTGEGSSTPETGEDDIRRPWWRRWFLE